MSDDGRYVAWGTFGAFVPDDTNSSVDVYMRDRQDGNTERISVDSDENQGSGHSGSPSVSDDGRYVAFSSGADLAANDTNGVGDIFVRDRDLGTTELASVSSAGVLANSHSFQLSISGDGRFVAFASLATTLLPPGQDTNGAVDIYLRDLVAGTTERVSVDSNEIQSNGESSLGNPGAISDDGRYVAFQSNATNLVNSDTNGFEDVFVRDTVAGTTTRISVNSAEVQADFGGMQPAISGDGQTVAFTSGATNLVGGDTNSRTDMFVRDIQAGLTERITVDRFGRASVLERSRIPLG